MNQRNTACSDQSLPAIARKLCTGALLALAGIANSTPAAAQTTLTVPVDTKVTTTAFTYEPSGLVKTETAEPNGAAGITLETTYQYDAKGNREKLTLTGWNGTVDQARYVTTGWDTAGRFPISTTNAKAHKEEREYDPRFGAITKLVDVNGIATRWTYDGFGRKVKETRGHPDKTSLAFTDYTTWKYEKCVEVGCPSVESVVPVYVVTTEIKSSPDSNNVEKKLAPTTKVYYDRLNRVLRTQTEGFNGATLSPIYQDNSYNAAYGLQKASLPYFSGATPQWTNYEYDELRRKVAEIAPNGVRTEIGYSALKTTTWVRAIEGDRSRSVLQDDAGRALEVVDANGRSTYFVRDAQGNLTHTVDPYGNTTKSDYDIRGRKKSMVDPDMGAWIYVYNAFGELYDQTDAKNQSTKHAYDELGRLTRRVEPDLTADFVYDTASKGLGKLAQASTSNGYCRSHTYDALSRPAGTTVRVGGATPCTAPTEATFNSSVTYDAMGRPDTATYPTGVVLRQGYNDTLGFLEKVYNYTGNAAGTVYWRWQESDALGRVTKYLNGNNIATLKAYDAQTTWLQAIYAGRSGNPAGGDVQWSGYKYDSIGNLKERADRFDIPNLVEKAEHDLLGRLKSYALFDASGSSESSGSRVTMNYDALGNIKSKSDVGTYYYNPSGATSLRPHAVAEIRGPVNASYAYNDANGNMTEGATRKIAYTTYNMVASAGNNAICHRFVYQAEHQRMQQAVYNTACAYAGEANIIGKTLYLHPDAANGLSFERETKGGATTYKHYINAGGMVVGMLTTNSASVSSNATGSASYFHYDHLGSVVAVSDAAAGLERRSFDPWGKARRTDGKPGTGELPNGLNAATDRGFTLHEHLEGLGLIHMNGRVYDFVTARFISADPTVQAPDDLQSYNRYAYVMNRPLNSVDPTGYNSMELGCYFCDGSSAGSGSPYVKFNADSGAPRWGGLQNGFTFGGIGAAGGFGAKSYNNITDYSTTMPLAALQSQRAAGVFGEKSATPAAGAVGAPGGQPASDIPIDRVAGRGLLWAADKVDDFNRSEPGRVLQGMLPGEAAAAGGFKAGLLWLGRLAKAENVAVDAAKGMPDAALLCRGGACKAENFLNGSGVTRAADGTLSGVSTQSRAGASVSELAKPFRNNQVGVTTVGDVRRAGGRVTADGHAGNPNHATVDGLTAQQLERLFSPTIPNPVPSGLRGF